MTSHLNVRGTLAGNKASRAMDGTSRAATDGVVCVFMSGQGSPNSHCFYQ